MAGFVTHQPPPFPMPSLSAASSASMAPLLIAPPSGFVPQPVCPPPVVSMVELFVDLRVHWLLSLEKTDDHFYIVLFSALDQTHFAFVCDLK